MKDTAIVFKVGDSVIITNPDDGEDDIIGIGNTGEVRTIHEDHYTVTGDNGDYYFYADYELTKSH